MKGRISNKLGEVNISTDVISTYAGTVAVECFGVVGMAQVSVKDGLVKLLKGEALQKGIEVSIEDNTISLKMHIIVAYGVSISAVADNLIENVRYKVTEFTGMKVQNVEIFVEGVKPID
ncbi:MAG: Asp23/Gls24 family envelope stress response protein [Eubacteriales bacterium]|nr:Asp23/Gls24 family envelope stress response protein [Eubacteriales bacterium]